MAGRGPRTGGRHQLPDAARHAPEAAQAPEAAYAAEAAYGVDAAHSVEAADMVEAADRALVRISDLAGRPRGTGFVADHQGTVITSHEAVDGLARLVLHAPGDRTCLVPADSVTLLPSLNLALIHLDGLGTDGLGLAPLPVTVRDSVESGTYVRIAAGGWREARVLGGTSAVTYTATDRFHLLDDALELAIGTAGSDALRLGGGAAGGPVIDAATGAVVAVLGTALHSGRRVGGFAVPLSAGRMASGSGTGSGPGTGSGSDSGFSSGGALAELLARNAATVPAYGDDLNLAGVLELAATVEAQPGSGEVDPVERADAVGELRAFGESPYAVLGLVGAPGSGRTTELAALSARRDRGPEPAPTLWLRGADLLDADSSVADAARRALERAGRIVAASASGSVEEARGVGTWAPSPEPGPSGGEIGELGDIRPERLARLARDAGRPLLLLLDSPEEMPPALAHRLSGWTEGTAEWLRAHGARLVVACRAEYWEWAGAEFPRELLYGSERGGGEAPGGLPACVRLGDLDEGEARRARARYGVPEGALDGPDARHPLMLRLLSEVRAAMSLPAASVERDEPVGSVEPVERDESVEAVVGRDEVFAAYLDLMCLRVAVRLAAANGLRGTAVRRLAARVSGQVHAAARRCLGPGQGSWTARRSSPCSRGGRCPTDGSAAVPAGRPRSSRRASSCPPETATASPTRSWPTGSRACTSTSTRHSGRWCTTNSGMSPSPCTSPSLPRYPVTASVPSSTRCSSCRVNKGTPISPSGCVTCFARSTNWRRRTPGPGGPPASSAAYCSGCPTRPRTSECCGTSPSGW